MEISAINAKTIEVKFNRAVDTSKAVVELYRDTFKQNVTLIWAEDGKSVEIVGASNFQEAEYTVKVGNLEAKVKVEKQKVTSIEILDDIAVASIAIEDGKFKSGTTATVAYVVKDQYGTDITKNTDLTTNDDATVKAIKAKGIVELSGSAVEGKKPGDLVAVVLVDTNTGKSASATLKLSAVSAVDSIEVEGIYDAKAKEVELNDKSKVSDVYIVLNLKDQYGKEIKEKEYAKNLLITNTNTTNLKLVEESSKVKVEKVKIGDKDKLVIQISKIEKAGNTDIIFISTTSGKSTTYTVKVVETSITDGISVSQPEYAVAKADILIPITVTDKDGNVITDKKLLSTEGKGIKVAGELVDEKDLEVKDGQLYYVLDKEDALNKEGTQAFVFQTATYKVATITIKISEEAKAAAVRGLKDPLVLSMATHKDGLTIDTKKHLVIEDQYGRAMKDSTATVVVALVGESEVVSVGDANKVTPVKNGTAKLKIKLVTEYTKDGKTLDSSVEVSVRVTDGKEFDSYEIKEIGLTQAADVDEAGAKEFTVYGILNGGKVELEPEEFTAAVNKGSVSEGKVTINKANLDKKDEKEINTEFTLTVTINATGQVLKEKFIVSADAQKVKEFFFTEAEADSAYKDAKEFTKTFEIKEVGESGVELKDLGLRAATVDQYGNKKVVAVSDASFTVIPADKTEVDITGNGTNTAKVTLAKEVEETNITVNVKIGDAVKELKVKLVAK